MRSQTTTSPARTLSLPPCTHPATMAVLRRLKVRRYVSAFSAGERAVARRRLPMPVSQWAERHRVIHTSSRPGPWRNAVTMYTAGIMDASFMPGVRTIVMMKSPQTGGTEAVHNCVGYSIDRQPGPVLYVYPDEVTARENARDRILPMLQDSPRLRELMSPDPDDTSSLRIALAHTAIYMAWSGSPSRLGNKPIRYLVLDELDKYQDASKEASSESLAEKRCTTWGSRARIWKISTPTTEDGPIARAYAGAQARYGYAVKCPQCGRRHVMAESGLRWPEGVRPLEVYSQRLGRYECPHCRARWTDADRDEAVRRGGWIVPATGEDMEVHVRQTRPAVVAFHVPALISPFVSLSELCQRKAEVEGSSDLQQWKDWRNNYLGLAWTELHEERDPEALARLCDDRPRGTVPGGGRVSCLLAGVDTQKGYFRYVIRAYGFGQAEESWLVQCGALDSFRALEQTLLEAEYRDADGKAYHVAGVMMDAMGSRTAEVYAWAARHRGRVFPWQGRQSMTAPYSMTALEYFPSAKGDKVKIPGGLTLFRCDTTFFKSGLAAKLAVAPEDAGAFHLHRDADGELAQYFAEMTAEVWDDARQCWINPKGRANHYWDCEVMASALAYIKGVRNSRKEPPKPEGPAQRKPAPAPARQPARPWGGGRYE